MHFTDALPLPRSVTKTIYDIANEDPKYTTQISYIDTVMLDSDMKRLLPLTAMYAPNKEWEGKKTEMNEIAEKVLKNHMFEKLYRCDELRSMVDMPILSVNGKMWTVSVNKNDFPCFESADDAAPKKACIIKCDILARNGIVHELDTLLLFEAAETRPPSEFGGSFPSDSATGTGGGSPESTPTVFQRPTPKAPAAAPKSNESSSATATNTVSSFSVVLAAGLALVANAAILV